jgi:hypothetical protein
MKSGSLADIKKELQELEPARLAELCIALAKYKKDNKEYLDYLLFEAHDKEGFVQRVKELIDENFVELKPDVNLYYAKKSLRKILRIINKYVKYIGDKASGAELHIYFLKKLKASKIPVHKSARLVNLEAGVIKKTKALISALHEDLQYDHIRELEAINISF